MSASFAHKIYLSSYRINRTITQKCNYIEEIHCLKISIAISSFRLLIGGFPARYFCSSPNSQAVKINIYFKELTSRRRFNSNPEFRVTNNANWMLRWRGKMMPEKLCVVNLIFLPRPRNENKRRVIKREESCCLPLARLPPYLVLFSSLCPIVTPRNYYCTTTKPLVFNRCSTCCVIQYVLQVFGLSKMLSFYSVPFIEDNICLFTRFSL